MAAELKVGIGADISGFEKGVSDAVKEVGKLVSNIGNIKVPEIKIPPISVPKIPPIDSSTFDKLNIELNKIGANTELFGKSLEGSKRQLSAYKVALEDLIGQGLRPTHPEVLKLADDISKLDKEITEATKKIPKLKSGLESLKDVGDKISSVGKSLSIGLTAPIVALGVASIKTYGDLEAMKKGLIAVMGSAGAAESEFTKLLEVAKLPGLGLKEAAKGSVTLQSAGFSADRARQSLLAFGNALATVGKGGVELGMVNLALSQLQNKSSGFGQDLRQLTEQLPQLRSALQNAFGTIDTEKIGKMGVTGAQVVDKLITEFEKLPKVTGGINNAFENLKDAIFINLSKIGQNIDKSFNISAIVDKLIGYLNSAVEAFENLSPSVQKAIIVVAGLAAAAGPLLVVIGSILAVIPSVIAGFTAMSGALAVMTGPIGLVVIGIGAIIAAVVSNWDKIKPYILNTINYFRELYSESIVLRVAITAIATTFKNVFSVVSNVLKTAYEIFKSFAKATADLFSGIGSIIKGVLTGDFTEIKNGVSKIGVAIIGGIDNVKKDSIKGFNDLFTDIKTNLMGGLSSILNDGKLKPITNLNILDENAIANDTNLKIDNIADKLKKKKKEKIKIIELEPIDTSALKESFDKSYKDVSEYQKMLRDLYYNNSEAINNSIASIPTTLSDAAISMQSGIASVMEGLQPLSDFGNFFANSLDLAFDTVVSTITESFSAIGEALSSGGNVLSAVGNVVLSGIGSFLGELGKQMVQYGVAALAMSVLSKLLLNPITAAPAAIALIAAGAALSLASGAIKGTLKGSNNGNGTVSSGGGGSSNYSTSFSGGSSGSGEVVFRIAGNDLVGVLSRQQDKNTRTGG